MGPFQDMFVDGDVIGCGRDQNIGEKESLCEDSLPSHVVITKIVAKGKKKKKSRFGHRFEVV